MIYNKNGTFKKKKKILSCCVFTGYLHHCHSFPMKAVAAHSTLHGEEFMNAACSVSVLIDRSL